MMDSKYVSIKNFNDEESGLIWCVVITDNDGHPKLNVTFYDTRYEFTDFGQHVATYYLETIAIDSSGNGLNLYGGVPDWSVSAECMNRIRKHLVKFLN